MLTVIWSNSFKKSYKKVKCYKNFNKDKFDQIIFLLSKQQKIPESFKDHKLSGELYGFRDLHLAPDIIIIYEIRKNELILYLLDIGSHADLF